MLPLAQVANVAIQCDRLVTSETVIRRQLEAVVGLLNFAGAMLRLGRLFITPIIIWMNSFTTTSRRDFTISVTSSLREALLPFRDVKFLAIPTYFRRLVPSLDILTDASDSGWSGVISRHRVQDFWTSDYSYHINVREMLGILYSLQFFQEVLADRTIQIFTYSLVVLFCLRRMGFLHSPPLDKVTRELILFCHQRNISFVPFHISGKINVLADQGSGWNLLLQSGC